VKAQFYIRWTTKYVPAILWYGEKVPRRMLQSNWLN